ncbi:MAG TPA: protein-methionine-sulfoxide reductase heme-binding subunit MsrQ [Candidatus Methylomirabilis sp.]|nr:protein-methionine-sulfoxide reductase heme-binding subunit MsrQ [Candidatus Methylomirabilis sp.]
MSRPSRVALKVGVWTLCLAPLAVLLFRVATRDLGANPISFVTNWLGDWTLRLLLASLAMTPLRVVFGLSWPLALRRLLGLFAFTYASLHFSVWLVVDHFFDWREMGADIVKRPYVTVGMTALMLMLPLAATSTVAAIKRLGGKNWQRLHRLAYAIGVAGVLHYLWLAKKANPAPYYYAAALVLLLSIRVWDWGRRRVARSRAAATLSGTAEALGTLSPQGRGRS